MLGFTYPELLGANKGNYVLSLPYLSGSQQGRATDAKVCKGSEGDGQPSPR